MTGDDAACSTSLHLASGVVLCSSSEGLLATFADGRLKRIDLHDRVEEAKLVATLRERGALDPSLLRCSIRVLLDERVLIAHRPLDVTDHLGLPAAVTEARSEARLPVVLGWLFDARFHESLAGAALRGEPLLVVCATSSGMWLAYDDAKTRPCIRCALLLDTGVARTAAAAQRLASTAAAAPPPETLAVAASWLARWSRKDCPLPAPGRALVFDVGEGTCQWEAYGAHPSCTCGGRRSSTSCAAPDLDWRTASRRRFSPLMCVDGGTELGPARVVYRGSRRPWPVSPSDFGVALAGPPDAQLRALAEGIERFCMLHALPDVRDTAAVGLEGPHLDQEAVEALLFRTEERSAPSFPFPRYTPESVLDWSWAAHAKTEQRVLVPTSLVGRVPRGSARLVHGTSNGYACHRQADAAARAALLEVVERDAVLLGWYLGRSFPRIEIDIEGPVFAWLATQDIDVPVVLMAGLFDRGVTRIAAAAGMSFDEALTRASAELRALAASPASTTRAATVPTAHDGGPLEHQRYFDGAGRQHLARLAADAGRVAVSELRARWPRDDQTLAGIVGALEGAGLDAWLVQRAIPDLFGTRWHVVRAVVPGCVELSWGGAFRRLASPRVRAALDAGERLNPLPHPLA